MLNEGGTPVLGGGTRENIEIVLGENVLVKYRGSLRRLLRPILGGKLATEITTILVVRALPHLRIDGGLNVIVF